MSDLLRRIKRATENLDEFNNANALDYGNLEKEEKDLCSLHILIRVCKRENLIPPDFNSPVCSAAEGMTKKLKSMRGLSFRMSEEELAIRQKRIKEMVFNMARSDERLKDLWKTHVQEIPYPL